VLGFTVAPPSAKPAELPFDRAVDLALVARVYLDSCHGPLAGMWDGERDTRQGSGPVQCGCTGLVPLEGALARQSASRPPDAGRDKPVPPALLALRSPAGGPLLASRPVSSVRLLPVSSWSLRIVPISPYRADGKCQRHRPSGTCSAVPLYHHDDPIKGGVRTLGYGSQMIKSLAEDGQRCWSTQEELP
jgi:hypothetical protein